jgi:plasmid replication initiation protein
MNDDKKVNNDKALITKDNILVEHAGYRLSVNEQLVLLTLISKISPEDVDFKPYIFKISELYELLGFKKESRAVKRRSIKKILKSLHSNVIEIVTSDRPGFEGREIMMLSSWIIAPVVDWDLDTVSLKVSDVLRPYLLDLKERYTQYRLDEFKRYKFSSEYSLRFLEFCKNHEPRSDFNNGILKNRYVNIREYEIAELRFLLKIPEKIYYRVHDFKKRILEPAQRDINAKTSSCFEFEMIKTGRSMTHVRMLIYGELVYNGRNSENPNPNPLPPPDAEEKSLRKRLRILGVSSAFQDVVFASGYDRRRIRIALAAVEEWKKHKKIKHPSRVFELSLLQSWISKEETSRRLEEEKTTANMEDVEAAKALSEGLEKRKLEEEKKLIAASELLNNEYQELTMKQQMQYYQADDKPGFILNLCPIADDFKFLNEDQRATLKINIRAKIEDGMDFGPLKSFVVTELLGYLMSV